MWGIIFSTQNALFCFFDLYAMTINIVHRTSGALGGSIRVLPLHHPDKSVDCILLLPCLYLSPILALNLIRKITSSV